MTTGAPQPDSPERLDRRLSKRQRLTKQLQFERTYAQQQRFVGRFMVLWRYTGEDGALRLGVVAGRRVGPAVIRNRAKRRLREAFRLNRPGFQGRMDVVLVARPAVIKAKWGDLVQEINRLAAQAGLKKCANY
ncbi:MAG: ribonuclease P protein component [Kiritimatiellia bacterium]